MTTTMPPTTCTGKATTVKKLFSRETSVCITIHADAAIVWSLLTNAFDYPRWNSTVLSIDGEIALGQKIKLKSTLAPNRTFTLTVKEYEPEKLLLWGDAQGQRAYTLESAGKGTVVFSMRENIGGLMFPLYGAFIPPFDESFEHFARDIQKEAEAIMRTK